MLSSARSLFRPLLFLGLILSTGVSACGSDFAERSEITSLRFLGIQTDPPWLFFSETSTITPLVAGLVPGRALSFSFSWYPLRGPNNSGFECLVTVEDIEEAGGEGAPDLPDNLFELPDEGGRTRFTYALIPELVEEVCGFIRGQDEIPAFVTIPSCADGTFPVSIRVDVSDGVRTISGFKDLILVFDETLAGPRNQIPDIEGLGIDLLGPRNADGSLPANQSFLARLGPDEGGGSPLDQLNRLSERYTGTQVEATEDNEEVIVRVDTREQLVFSWFADAGSFSDNRTGFLPDTVSDFEDSAVVFEAWEEARSNPYSTPGGGAFIPGEIIRLFLIVRDERGGTSWTTTTATVGGVFS